MLNIYIFSLNSSVEDIDAWTGAVSERRMPGSMIGRLNACIIGRQFRSLRKGDRFWYEFQEPNVGFTNGEFIMYVYMYILIYLCAYTCVYTYI